MSTALKLEDTVTGQCSEIGYLSERDRFQTVNDAFDAVRQALERSHEVKALQNRSFAESYACYGASIICDFEMTMPLEGLRGDAGSVLDDPIADRKLYASLVYRHNSSQDGKLVMSNQQAVFVFDVEIVKSEDGLAIPSLVGLYDIHDKSLDLFAGVLFQSIDGSFKSITGFPDREFCLGMRLDAHLKPSMVKSGAEIVQRVPQDQKKFVREWLGRGDAESIVSAIDVFFYGQSVRVSLCENLPFSVKIIEF